MAHLGPAAQLEAVYDRGSIVLRIAEDLVYKSLRDRNFVLRDLRQTQRERLVRLIVARLEASREEYGSRERHNSIELGDYLRGRMLFELMNGLDAQRYANDATRLAEVSGLDWILKSIDRSLRAKYGPDANIPAMEIRPITEGFGLGFGD